VFATDLTEWTLTIEPGPELADSRSEAALRFGVRSELVGEILGVKSVPDVRVSKHGVRAVRLASGGRCGRCEVRRDAARSIVRTPMAKISILLNVFIIEPFA